MRYYEWINYVKEYDQNVWHRNLCLQRKVYKRILSLFHLFITLHKNFPFQIKSYVQRRYIYVVLWRDAFYFETPRSDLNRKFSDTGTCVLSRCSISRLTRYVLYIEDMYKCIPTNNFHAFLKFLFKGCTL